MSYQCKVWLDNYTGQYFPGDVIQGRVICNFDSETTFRTIKIRIKGEEHTAWLGEESYYDSTENKHLTRQVRFTGDNDVLTHQVILHGNDSNTSSLQPGQHLYPFTFTLPFNLPSTYNCQYGGIFYKIVGIVDRPMRQDYEDEVMFNVASPIDLNKLGPEVLQPVPYSDDKTVCCLCCASGPITMDAELSKQALVPGETATVNVRLSNLSNVNIESVTFELKQKITYCALEPSRDEKVDEILLTNLNNIGVGPHADVTFEFQVDLPMTTVVPNFDQCRLFKAQYSGYLTAVLPSYHNNLQIRMEPIVGNIPIGQTIQHTNPQQPGFVPLPTTNPSMGPYTGPGPMGGPGGQYPGPTPPMSGQYPGPTPPMGGQYPGPGPNYPMGGQYPGPGPNPPMGGQYPAPGPNPPMGGPYPAPGPNAPMGGGQYPGTGPHPPPGAYNPYQGGAPAQYSPQNNAPTNGYPQLPTMGYQGYPPPMGYPQGPMPPAPNPKAQEAGQPRAPNAPQEMPPPTYDSLNLPK